VNLDFIAPRFTDGAPVPRSPMLDAAERSGARAGIRDGWVVPVGFGDEPGERYAIDETVGVADSSALTKTELLGPSEILLAQAHGLTLGSATAHGGAWWCPIARTRALVLGTKPDPADLGGIRAVDVTSQFCALTIAGPFTRRLLSSVCALDLRPQVAPPGSFRPGSVARTPGLVLVEAPERLLVMVGAALAEYLWTVLIDAASRLDGRPVGTDLLASGGTALQEASANA
jgi:glycine cleavage system aminomethyltransferase T